MVKKDGMILEQYLYDEKAYCLKKQYDGTDCSDSMVQILRYRQVLTLPFVSNI